MAGPWTFHIFFARVVLKMLIACIDLKVQRHEFHPNGFPIQLILIKFNAFEDYRSFGIEIVEIQRKILLVDCYTYDFRLFMHPRAGFAKFCPTICCRTILICFILHFRASRVSAARVFRLSRFGATGRKNVLAQYARYYAIGGCYITKQRRSSNGWTIT